MRAVGENVPALIFVVMPVLIAAGAALVTGALMQARTEVAVSHHREALAEARALLTTQHRAMEERVRAAEEAARRKALDEFLGDVRVEQRQYLRQSSSGFARRRSLVVEERVCFRNVPLTGWVPHELDGAVSLLASAKPEQGLLPLAVATTADGEMVNR